MQYFLIFSAFLGLPALAQAQSDMNLLLFPDQYYVNGLLRIQITPTRTAEDKASGEDFEMLEYSHSLRYNLKHSKEKDVYLTMDTYGASIDNTATLSQSGDTPPEDLYDVSAGILYREVLDNGWTFGGALSVGSASDTLFDTSDELYLRSLAFLRIPHLEHTSWVLLARIKTNGDFPVVPGAAYAFPISRRAYMMVGFPVLAAGGQLTDALGFSVWLIPSNTSIRLDYQLTERVTPYLGYTNQARFFSRADRDDDDDRIRTRDGRVFGGTTIQVFERGTLDLRAGYVFDREIGEGDDYKELNNNTIEIENTAFASLGYQYTF